MSKTFLVLSAALFALSLLAAPLRADDNLKNIEKAAVALKDSEKNGGKAKEPEKKADPAAQDKTAEKSAATQQKVATLDTPAAPKKTDSSLSERVAKSILLYVPNRIIDATDILTSSVGAGPEFSLQVKCTNYLQFGGTHGDKYFLCKNYHRQYGGAESEGWSYGFGPLGAERKNVEKSFGTAKDYFIGDEELGIMDRSLDAYTERKADFWSIGVRVGWLVNTEFFVHPSEVADFVTGIFCIDLMNDDFEDTAAIRVE